MGNAFSPTSFTFDLQLLSRYNFSTNELRNVSPQIAFILIVTLISTSKKPKTVCLHAEAIQANLSLKQSRHQHHFHFGQVSQEFVLWFSSDTWAANPSSPAPPCLRSSKSNKQTTFSSQPLHPSTNDLDPSISCPILLLSTGFITKTTLETLIWLAQRKSVRSSFPNPHRRDCTKISKSNKPQPISSLPTADMSGGARTQTPTFINLPPPPADPATPSDAP